MASEFTHGDVPAPVAENETVQSSIASTANKENKKKKMPDYTHGLRFESKLLALFCVRGLGTGYKFELSKEKEEEGGKLEDLIFRYEVPDETLEGKHWRYRYLQAKHKENEKEKITADHLLNYKPKGDFSLPKYFHSFYKIRARGDDIHDCIICTNIGFNLDCFEKGGIELVSINDQLEDILKFGAQEKTAHYKLKINNDDWHRRLKEEWSPVQLLAEELKNCATNNKTTDIRAGMLSSYHVALVDEHVIDCTTKKFHQDFVSDAGSLSDGAKELRQTLCALGEDDWKNSKTRNEWKNWKFKLSNNFGKSQSAVKNSLPRKITEEDVDDFFDKLVFVVDMPSEEKFEEILETKDMSKFYQPDKCKDQTVRILYEVSKDFSNQEQNFWLTSERAKNILLDGVTKTSLEFQSQLKKEIKFNDSAIQMMADQLKQRLLESSQREKVERIAATSPQHTAVKVISAVQILLRELNQEGNYLVASSSRLQNEEEMEMWKNILKLQKSFYNFFVVVCDDDENFISDNKCEDLNFVIIISRDESSATIKEEIQFTDLSEHFQKRILSKPISFQGENVTVGDLVGNQPEEVIDFSSMKELLFTEKEVKIPSFNTPNFEETVYLKRRLQFPFENQFELGGECRISSDGHIEWLVEKEKREAIWKKIMNDVTNQASKPVEDIDLMNLKEKGNEKSIVIISGVAGTGKSTLLCHYYEEIKKAKPDHWVIRVNLVDYEAVLKLDQITDLDVVDLFINRLHVVDDKSSFSRSLLRHRMKKGDRIVVMFDGFDQINELCQRGAIKWMKAISKKKSIRLYVTTRTHMLGDLQFQLSQLAYNLENFTEEDQIKHLTSYWVKELNLSGDKDGPLQQFAKSLIERVSETLKDEEKSFVGIPVQCRILAECFQSNVKELITLNCAEHDEESRQSVSHKISCLLDGEKFDLVKLYNLLMDTKRRVFREEKSKTTPLAKNKIVTYTIIRPNRLINDVESHLTKLAIKTIVEDEKIVDVLWPPQLSHKSNEYVAAEEKEIAMNSLSFGLTIESGENKTNAQFLHRTYAEYFFARYLYEGFLLDDERRNKLLENESIQKLILNKILSENQYDGVQVFFNSMLKNLVDDDQEWRNRIIQRDLQERFTKFAKYLFTQFLRKYPSSQFLFQKVTEKSSRIFPNALHYSLSTGKEKIFKLLCDLFYATFDEKLIRKAMMNSFMANKSYFSFKFFRRTESELFERFLGYLYSDESKDPATNADDIKYRWNTGCLPPCNLEYSQWNGKEQQNMVRLLLEFIVDKKTTFEEFFPHMHIDIVPMLTFLIFNEKYENHLQIFLGSTAKHYDDSECAKLLKEAIRSKKHFVPGRIVKLLIILYKSGRHNVLTQLYGIVLAMEPEACQDIFRPLEEEGVIPEDLHLLLERDSYRLTRLHGAAFHGNTKAVEEMLKKISQNLTEPEHKNVADKIINEVMARDQYGFTPYYVAAARGHEEIYHKMLAFLKEILPDISTLEEHLIDEGGFVHRALSDSIDSDNIQMFQLILIAIKKVLGQKELLRVLHPELHIHPLERNSFMLTFFDRCKTKEFFNVMAKIVVTRDDNVADYTDLYDLVMPASHNLKIIDAENLQGLLSLKGAEDFTKRILDTESLSLSSGFELISRHFLKHFTKDQLEEFVQTITNKTRKFENREFTVDSARAHNKEIEDEIRQRYFNGWPIDLVFEDKGNGSTTIHAHRLVPRPSYWRDYIVEFENQLFVYPDSTHMKLKSAGDGFPFRGYVDRICECFKYVGDKSTKELLLHEDAQSYIMISFPQNALKLMLNCLTQENKEEVKQKWKNKAPLMKNFFPLTSQILSNETFHPRYCSAILHFYLEYGSGDHLKEFAKVVTVLHNISGVQHSLWSYVFENVDFTVTHDILKLVLEKIEFIGRDNVKWLLIHEIDNVPFIIKAVSWGEDVDLWLAILPNKIREEIQQFIQNKAPDFIEKAFRDPTAYLKKFIWGHYLSRLNTFTFFLSYSNEHQLQSFVENITSKRVGGQQEEYERSMWAELFNHDWTGNDDYGKTKTKDFAKMNKFMKMVSEKLGPNAVKELVLHQDGELLVIFYLALRGEDKMLETLLNYLPDKDRKKVQRKVDEFLDETYKISLMQQHNETYRSDEFYSTREFGLTKRENPVDKKPDYDERKCLPEITSELTKQYEFQNADVLHFNKQIITIFLNRITERTLWEFTIDRKNLICSGSFFAVFRGSFNGKKVAIKRVRADRIKFQEKEEKIFDQLDHPNVIKLLQVTKNVDFR